MTRIISLLSTGIVLLSLFACGGGGASSNNAGNTDGVPSAGETQPMSVMMDDAMSANEFDEPMEFDINNMEDDLGDDETAYASQFPTEDG